jgi:succinoglycan biosynthesis transport protein ExoP
MQLEQYFAVIRKWLWLIVASVLIATVSSYLGTLQMPRIYQATTTVMVGQVLEQPDPNAQDLYLSQQLALTYADMVRRQPILEGVTEMLGLEYVPSAEDVSARQVPGTQLLEIAVRDTHPERAMDIADGIAHQLILQSPTEATEEQERRAFVRTQLVDLEFRIQETQDEIDEEQARLESANSAQAIQQYQANVAALQQKLSTYQSTYAALLPAVQGGVNYISVVEPATMPTVPISPRVGMTVMLAAAIGLVLAVGGAFLIEYLDDTIKTPDDATRAADLPTLAGIARIEGETYPERLIAVQHPRSPIVEAFRLLRANLQFSSVDRPARTLMVTSPGPGEGKSVTLANLAVVMAQSGLRVVAVDADLRRPVLHKIFGLSNTHGLSDAILQSNPPVSEHLQATEVENLWVLASGPLPPNPAELLGSERMGAVIEELKGQVDMVLLDSPPALVVPRGWRAAGERRGSHAPQRGAARGGGVPPCAGQPTGRGAEPAATPRWRLLSALLLPRRGWPTQKAPLAFVAAAQAPASRGIGRVDASDNSPPAQCRRSRRQWSRLPTCASSWRRSRSCASRRTRPPGKPPSLWPAPGVFPLPLCWESRPGPF